MNFSKYTILLKAAIGVIVFLFGTFSGFLLKFAPPDPSDELKLPIGIAQFLALALLLYVSLLCNYQAIKKKADQKKFVWLWLWISGGLILVFAISSLVYYGQLKSKTIKQSNWNARLIRGTELTKGSREICQEDKFDRTDRECETYLLTKFYTADQVINQHLLWTEESVNSNKSKLLVTYIIVIASISGLLFSLVELLSWNMFAKKEPVRKRKPAPSS